MKKEREWEKDHGWMVGTNFNPSTSINQLEFWQQDTYDQETIERELEWSTIRYEFTPCLSS